MQQFKRYISWSSSIRGAKGVGNKKNKKLTNCTYGCLQCKSTKK
jgi:hypothetical protein